MGLEWEDRLMWGLPFSNHSFLKKELLSIVKKGAFSYCLKEQIGEEIYSFFGTVGDDDYGGFAPAEEIYNSVIDGWCFDPEWVVSGDGFYYADDGVAIPCDIDLKVSGSEALACFGLIILNDLYYSLGNPIAPDFNPQGVTRREVEAHQCACLFEASRALIYAFKLFEWTTPERNSLPLLSEEQIASALHVRRARSAAEARHNGPSGSRAKKNEIREIWATGKYSTRDLCAEQEYQALGVSYSKARRDLRGTPEPSPWPARESS